MDWPLYTVQPCKGKKRLTLFGHIHWADNAGLLSGPVRTLCGKYVTHNWFILTNDGQDHSGAVSCPTCKKGLAA